MPGDTQIPANVLSKEELLLVERMIEKRVPDIDGTMERAYEETDWRLPQAQRRLIARNAVLANLLQTGPLPVEAARPAAKEAAKPKESPFDEKPRVFTLEDV